MIGLVAIHSGLVISNDGKTHYALKFEGTDETFMTVMSFNDLVKLHAQLTRDINRYANDFAIGDDRG